MNIKIVGSGSHIPEVIVKNSDFNDHVFLDEDGSHLRYPEAIVGKFRDITGIEERRYASNDMVASDLAYLAASMAVEDAEIDQETLDHIILAHNYGDVEYGKHQSDMVPSLASRVKSKLGIRNPQCVAYDLVFGCPGWIEGMLHANSFIKSGMSKRCLVIGAETLSRVTDRYDRDSMIYADGAGAVVVEATKGNEGILSYHSATYATEESAYLFFGESYKKNQASDTRYIKMKGRKIYEFALSMVPSAMKKCLEKGGIDISEVKKILIHQANEKMDKAILDRFYKLFDMTAPEDIMPMSIHKYGNSSVATIPTLYDMIIKGRIDRQFVSEGDIFLFASVGAGMNINAFAYRI